MEVTQLQLCRITTVVDEPSLWDFARGLSARLAHGQRLRAPELRTVLSNFSIQYLQGHYLPLLTSEKRRMVAYRDEQIEVILIAWGAGMHTPIHDHAENGCLMLGLAGLLKESRYNEQLQLTETRTLAPGEVIYIDNQIGYHKIRGLAATGSLSLHIYSPPLYRPRQWQL